MSPVDRDVLSQAVSVIVKRYNPVEISLFGSRYRGQATEFSDWDFLVLLDNDAPDELFDPLYAWKTRELCLIPADLVVETEEGFTGSIGVSTSLAREIHDQREILYTREK